MHVRREPQSRPSKALQVSNSNAHRGFWAHLRFAWSGGGSDNSADLIAGKRLPHIELPSVDWRRMLGPIKWTAAAVLLAAVIVYEMHTSALESLLLSHYAKSLTYTVEPGPSHSIVYPRGGPLDQTRGYSRIPVFLKKLQTERFDVSEQARFSPGLARLARWGIAPPYRDLPEAGLSIRSREGSLLYSSEYPHRLFKAYDDIPRLVVDSLLFIENRSLAVDSADPRANPVLDWNRLAKASLLYAGVKLGLPVRLEGGSTLATQLEKYLHSPSGRTASVADKFRQMIGASLKVYREGPDTRAARRQLIVDYLNSIPLAAAPGYGEVHGLGDGLSVWFGMDLGRVCAILNEPDSSPALAMAYKHVLALLIAARAPNYYLIENRRALDEKADYYARLLARAGDIGSGFAEDVEQVSPAFVDGTPISVRPFTPAAKTTTALRTQLMRLLGLRDLYVLDQLDLEADTTVDAGLEADVERIFADLRNRDFLKAHGLRAEHLLEQGDPRKVQYSFLLYEMTPQGSLLRADTDTLSQPFDLNSGMKLQLGSTAKLRTLAHYLELVKSLYNEFSPLDGSALEEQEKLSKDPITQWAALTLMQNRGMGLESFLQKSLDRTYSASPSEVFFTGGGSHVFQNFDAGDNERTLTVREALVRSVNLVFIRLMRDIVRFHEARLPFDVDAVLNQPDNPVRIRLLKQVAEEEQRQALARAYDTYRNLPPGERISRLLGAEAGTSRGLALLFLAWHPEARPVPEEGLASWLSVQGQDSSPAAVRRLMKAYGNPRLNLADYAYLLHRKPLDIWCAGQLEREPSASWTELWNRSGEAREESSAWLFRSRNRRAQDLRLRIRIEEMAFEAMTPSWRRLGFPFERLVPSLATAIGSSSDRPDALAELMGIILDGGELRPVYSIKDLKFARRTPYETVFDQTPGPGRRVMNPVIARTLRDVLAGVIQKGTGIRAAGAFVRPDGTPIPAGGKTGSGDNRFEVFGPHLVKIASIPENRTATFVFYVGNRYYGVITACVGGAASANYRFTSALPVSILKLLAPAFNRRLAEQSLPASLAHVEAPVPAHRRPQYTRNPQPTAFLRESFDSRNPDLPACPPDFFSNKSNYCATICVSRYV